MSDPALPSAQRELGEKILSALTIVNMPVASYEWKYQPAIGEYQLIVSTPWFKDKGPSTTRQALADALKRANITEPTRFVRLQAPKAKKAQAGD